MFHTSQTQHTQHKFIKSFIACKADVPLSIFSFVHNTCTCFQNQQKQSFTYEVYSWLLFPFTIAFRWMSVSLRSSVRFPAILLILWFVFMIVASISFLFSGVKLLYFCDVPVVLHFLWRLNHHTAAFFSQQFHKAHSENWLTACLTFSAFHKVSCEITRTPW